MLLIATAFGSIAALTLSACGSDDSSSETTAPTGVEAEPALDADAPLEKQLNQVFPPPEPTAGAPPKAEQFIAAGQDACKGMTPSQVIDQYLPQTGSEDFSKSQEELIETIGKYEQDPTADFAAGQIAAGVYEATLPELQGRSGYQGCVYELAQQLRTELKTNGTTRRER
jgi:hypothetical protein